jgi:aspartate racemase
LLEASERPRIGIIAGSGPDAGTDLLSKPLAAVRRLEDCYYGDTDAPKVTIFSLPVLGLSMDLDAHHAKVLSCLLEAAREIAARTDLFCIACNTLHTFGRDILDLNLKAHFVSMHRQLVREHVGNP